MNLPIIITENDAKRLNLLVQSERNKSDAENLMRLKTELERAQVVPEQELPADVIAMNSTVEVEDLSDGEVMTFKLVYPDRADISGGRISVLAPLGMAMLGYRVGDKFEWPTPGGIMRVRVRRMVSREGTPTVTEQLVGN